MKTPRTNYQSDSDDEFISALQRYALRPPPPAWREEILAAAAQQPARKKPWHRSPWLRGMAAAWVVSLGFWADTRRMSPQTPGSKFVRTDSAVQYGQQDWQALLAALEKSGPPHRPSLLLPLQP